MGHLARLRVLETCLTDIRTGKLRPDVTRNGRSVRSLGPGAESIGGDVAENLQVEQDVGFGIQWCF